MVKMKLFVWNIAINIIASAPVFPCRVRAFIYKLFGVQTETTTIQPQCFIRSNRLKIGKGSWINNRCFFDNDIAWIEIGENCGIGMDVMFCTNSHHIGPSTRRCRGNITDPIKVGNGCWIGARSVILPGVTIGEGCVIAAGAVVNKNCEPNGLYAGVPARRIKELDKSELMAIAK